MLTINAGIKKDGKRLDGTYNVKLRFTLDRKIKRQSTEKEITKYLKIALNLVFFSYLCNLYYSLVRETYENRI